MLTTGTLMKELKLFMKENATNRMKVSNALMEANSVATLESLIKKDSRAGLVTITAKKIAGFKDGTKLLKQFLKDHRDMDKQYELIIKNCL